MVATTNWAYFPRNQAVPAQLRSVVSCFEDASTFINSAANNGRIAKGNAESSSNSVLSHVCPSLESLGFLVEGAKKAEHRISIPVLFGTNGRATKTFEADAYHPTHRIVVEVEAGRAVTNYQFLKDLFEACVMVDVDYLCIAVRNIYKTSRDFETVYAFMDTLYTSGRLGLPLKGVLIIGY